MTTIPAEESESVKAQLSMRRTHREQQVEDIKEIINDGAEYLSPYLKGLIFGEMVFLLGVAAMNLVYFP